MSELFTHLGRVAQDLRDLGFEYALVGGHAVGLRVRPRMTKDLDLAVAVENDAAAEALARELHARGYRITHLIEQENQGCLSTIRLVTPGSPSASPEIDLLFASSGIEQEIVASATPLDVSGVGPVPVASVGHLIAMKVLAADESRVHDFEDLHSLFSAANNTDLREARGALRLIAERGFDRGRKLEGKLEEHLHRFEERS